MFVDLRSYRDLLRQRTDEVLHYVWDPIGVAGAPGARDEYAAYVEPVVELLLGQADVDTIADYLLRVESENMELVPPEERSRDTAKVLLQWRDWILQGRG